MRSTTQLAVLNRYCRFDSAANTLQITPAPLLSVHNPLEPATATLNLIILH